MNFAPSQLSFSWFPLVEEALRLREAARKHDEERERLVGDCFGVLSGCVHEGQPTSRHRVDVDVDRPTASAADKLQVGGGIEHGVGHGCTLDDEHLDAAHPLRELRRRALVLAEAQLGLRSRVSKWR